MLISNLSYNKEGKTPATLMMFGRMTKTLGGVLMDEIVSGIYEIMNVVTGERYIGSSKNIKKRWSEHRSTLNQGHHRNPKLQNSFSKYGSSNFVFSVIEICTVEYLIEREQFYIDNHKPEYNLSTIAGRVEMSEESKKKLIAFHTGRKRSDETRLRMSLAQIEAQKGRVDSEETKRKRSASQIGKKMSPESNAKLSARSMGNKYGLGRKPSPETLAKMSAIMMGNQYHLGIEQSQETKHKMSVKRLAYWAKIYPGNQERDKDIVFMRDSGEMLETIARKYNISASRVRKIYKRECLKRESQTEAEQYYTRNQP